MKEDNKWCVYMHIFPNGKKYIGITSRNPSNRWGYMGKKYEGQMVYRAIQKYGWDNIEHKILYENLTKSEACKTEQELIAKYHTYTGDNECNGYNNSLGGEHGAYGVVRSDVTRAKMRDSFTPERRNMLSEKAKKQKHYMTDTIRKAVSEANKNRIISDSTREKMSESRKKNQITQYTKDGCLVKKWKSAIDIENNTGWFSTSIIKVCKGKGKSYKGFVWRYNDEPFNKFDCELHVKKPVLQYDLFGKYVDRYDSLTDAANKYNCEVSCIGNCCRGLMISSYGYIWYYEDEFSEELLNNKLDSFKNINGYKCYYWYSTIKDLIQSGETRQEIAKKLDLQWQFVDRVSKMKYLEY